MAGVYISYPFCNQKCSFCNFASGVSSRETSDRYGRTLLQEVRSFAWPWQPETVYFGGGTPSLMPQELLAQLMRTIPASRLCEVTLECAPGTLDEDAVRTWVHCGVNRVSLGVQSFVDAELRQVGRRHTAETVDADVSLLRRLGIENINIDLIAGLPGQNSHSWKLSLDWLERLKAPHASVYIFEVDEDSRLGNEIILGGKRYGAPNAPDDDLTSDLYEEAVEKLRRSGLERYEISNFAHPGWASRHNLKYWQLEPYAGFGLDAHSFDGCVRWSNPDTLESYFSQIDAGVPTARELTDTDAAEEHFFVGLRLMRGIAPSQAEWSRFAAPIEKHLQNGMLQRDGNYLRLSDRGVLLSNEIFADFIHA